MPRQIRDALQEVTIALPAAAAANVSGSLDLTQGGDVPEEVEFEIVIPDLPDLVDDKTATFTLHESADDDSFAAAAWAPTKVLTGAGGVGAAGFSLRVKPPASAKRYVALSQSVLTAGGDNTAVLGTLRLRF